MPGENNLEQCTHKSGASKNMGALFCSWKNSLERRTHKLGASKNMGAPFFLEKKNSLEQRTHKLGASRNPGPFFAAKCNMLAEDLMPRDIMSS